MLLSCGDALIDFVPVKSADGRDAYVPVAGGSCVNIAVAMSRLGAPTGFVGGISTDMLGTILIDHLVASKVDLRYVTRSNRETTLAFVRFVNGEPHYAFYDEATAQRMWAFEAGSIPFPAIDVVHVGSTTLINDPAASAYLAMVEAARGLTTISFDPNCRPSLVTDKPAFIARMEAFAAAADIIRMSDVDFDFLYGHQDFDSVASRYLANGARLVLVTEGSKGVTAWHAGAGKISAAAPKITLVDTIGAGDTFQGSFLVALKDAGLLDRSVLKDLTADQIHAALSFGTKCAAITCSRAGANPPWRHEVVA